MSLRRGIAGDDAFGRAVTSTRRSGALRAARTAFASVLLGLALTLAPYGAGATETPVPSSSSQLPAATPSPSQPASASASASPLANCSLVPEDDAARLLGYDVLPAGASARAAGTCFYSSQSVSQEGSVSYSIVTPAWLAQLRPYFRLYARRCGNVGANSPRAGACALAAKLADVTNIETYYSLRTGVPEAVPVDRLGDAAISVEGTLYVRYGTTVLEASVRRDGAFDLDRSERLVRLLLERLAV